MTIDESSEFFSNPGDSNGKADKSLDTDLPETPEKRADEGSAHEPSELFRSPGDSNWRTDKSLDTDLPETPEKRPDTGPAHESSEFFSSPRDLSRRTDKSLDTDLPETPEGRADEGAARKSSVHIILTAVAGPHLGKSFTFDLHDHFFVGRAKIAHFRLPKKDPFFSRLHFMVEVNPPACRLLDLKSTNGTSVNGIRVEKCDLKHGDLIEAGDTAFRVTMGSHRDDATSPTVQMRAEEQPPPPLIVKNEAIAVNDPRFFKTLIAPGWSPPGYMIESLIGQGGMGRVHRARRESDGAVVAIKIIRPALEGSPDCARFLREIEILGRLSHPNIVRLFAAGDEHGFLYFVMELVDGMNLFDRMKQRSSPMSVSVALKVVRPIFKALSYAHSQGFVHRDVKPQNILLAKRDGRLSVKLVDFGLSRAYQDSHLSGLTLTGDLCGTPHFMAPEQIIDARHVQPASDQYAIAAMLYWMLTQKHTHDFKQGIQHVLQQILLDEPVPIRIRRPDVPAEFAVVLHRALSKDPLQRFESIDEFGTQLVASCPQ